MRNPGASTSLRFLFVGSLVLLSCTDSTSPEAASEASDNPRMAITQGSRTLPIPRTLQLSIQDGRATGAVGWESSNRAVATVSETGLVTARFPGLATITARRGAEAASVTMTVTAASIDVEPYPLFINYRGTQLFSATIRDADGAAIGGLPVTWSTSDALIATIGANTGVVNGVALGGVTITARGGGIIGNWAVYVIAERGPALAFSAIDGLVEYYACGLEALTGHAYCWGDSDLGSLGAGEVPDSPFPVPVSGDRRFTSLSAGSYATCGIEAETQLAYCWGSNEHGDLGDGTFTTRWEPTPVWGGIRFARISASGSLTCGIEAQTEVGYCWGNVDLLWSGQVPGQAVPAPIVGGSLLRFAEISASYRHACGLQAETGLAYCWGSNDLGQLGDGTTINRLEPTPSGGGRRFTSIDAESPVTCALEARTALAYCWGSNHLGQVGDGSRTNRVEATLVGGGTQRFTSVSAGLLSCGIEEKTSDVYCWGMGHLVPTLVGDGSLRFSALSADGGSACAIETYTGAGYCWGAKLELTRVEPPLAL